MNEQAIVEHEIKAENPKKNVDDGSILEDKLERDQFIKELRALIEADYTYLKCMM